VGQIRVLIVDDHAVLRAGLELLIKAQPDLAVVGQAASASEALREAQRLNPDVVILDLALPDGSGVAAIGRLRQACPATRVLVLTGHNEPSFLHASLAEGARGYLVKAVSDSELLSAIRAVHQGRVFVDLNVPADAQPGFPAAPAGPPAGEGGTAALSRREREVLTLLAQGHTNREVADRLFLSVKTVETYRARVGEKLGLRSRADLVRYAVEVGLLAPGKVSSENPDN
jgi:two-component system, NarL family, response regulator NreC